MPIVTSQVETITPEYATALIEKNTHNRHLDERRVMYLVGCIERGEWAVNGEAIKLSSEDILLDGQHRLHAVALSGQTVQSLVVRGLDPTSQLTMDRVKQRTVGNQLTLLGEKNTTCLSGAVTWLIKYEGGTLLGSVAHPVSPQQVIEYIEQHPTIREACTIGKIVNRDIRIAPRILAALYFMFSQIDADDATGFFTSLGSGEDLIDGDPILALRRFCIREMAMQGSRRVDTTTLAAMTIKAWNAWRDGEKVKVLVWRRGGSQRENFPVPH